MMVNWKKVWLKYLQRWGNIPLKRSLICWWYIDIGSMDNTIIVELINKMMLGLYKIKFEWYAKMIYKYYI
jgi:hypothetical protein